MHYLVLVRVVSVGLCNRRERPHGDEFALCSLIVPVAQLHFENLNTSPFIAINFIVCCLCFIQLEVHSLIDIYTLKRGERLLDQYSHLCQTEFSWGWLITFKHLIFVDGQE